MATVQRSIRLDVPAQTAWEACVALLCEPDPARGMLARRCEPDPPRLDGIVVTTVAGARELRSRIVELDEPHTVSTASEDEGPSVRTRLAVGPDPGGSRVTLTSEAATGLTGRPWLARLLDGVILGRSQRRSARATLARVREIAARRDNP